MRYRTNLTPAEWPAVDRCCGTPQDITLQELRIETFFPADESSDRLLRSIGQSGEEP